MPDEKNKVIKKIEHPMEEFLDIEKGTTEVEVYQREGDLITADGYDDKDAEIDEQYQEIYESAMDGYDLLSEELHKVEGKYKARVGEVSVQHLNAALNAAKAKADLKQHKDKLEPAKSSKSASVNESGSIEVPDRQALLETLRKQMEENSNE